MIVIIVIVILKIQDSISSCIVKILLKSILTKKKIFFEDTFHKILFVHCVSILHSNYITTIAGAYIRPT